MADRLRQESIAQPAFIYSDSVIFDENKIMQKGDSVRSGLLIESRLPGFFLTSNAVYILQGHGIRLRVHPDVLFSMKWSDSIHVY